VVEKADAFLAGGSEVDRDGALYQRRTEPLGSRRKPLPCERSPPASFAPPRALTHPWPPPLPPRTRPNPSKLRLGPYCKLKHDIEALFSGRHQGSGNSTEHHTGNQTEHIILNSGMSHQQHRMTDLFCHSVHWGLRGVLSRRSSFLFFSVLLTEDYVFNYQMRLYVFSFRLNLKVNRSYRGDAGIE
jgi:hypothetical protein